MHIVLNGMFWSQPNVGSGQYLHGLINALPQIAPQYRYTLLVPKTGDRQKHAGLVAGGRWSVVEVPTPFDGRSENLAKLWFEQIVVPQAAAKLKANLLHIPYAAAPLVASIPVVTTVHDIIWHLLPEYRGKATFRAYARLVVTATRRASRILADSEHSRRDIIAHLGIAPEKVKTVLLAAGAQYHPMDREQARQEVAERYGLDTPFVYYVGGLDARKNVPLLLRAWSRLRRSGGPNATLAIAGRVFSDDPALFPDIDSFIDVLRIRDSVRRIDVPREDGPLLYNAATVFAFPSRYEGFGLGPLEAMACGTPVVASSASSLPEVTGDAALLAAPDDVGGWTEALWRLLADAGLREDLQRRGLQRAAQFSYTRVAQETAEVYEQALQANRKQGI